MTLLVATLSVVIGSPLLPLPRLSSSAQARLSSSSARNLDDTEPVMLDLCGSAFGIHFRRAKKVEICFYFVFVDTLFNALPLISL